MLVSYSTNFIGDGVEIVDIRMCDEGRFVDLVAVGEASAPHDDDDVADSGYSGKQPDAESQHQVGHEILARAELVRRRQAESGVSSQTAEPKLICHSTSQQALCNSCNCSLTLMD